jgi:hypothetical protein
VRQFLPAGQESVFKNGFIGATELVSVVKMQSTINFALSNAFAKLNLSSTLTDRTIAYLWREPETPPVFNLEKLNRQQVQRLDELTGKPDESKQLQKQFLTYVNEMSSTNFKQKSLLEHMQNWITPEDEDEDVVDVSFHLREYAVTVKTHRVYELRNGVHVYVGQLGMNEFRDMIMPEIED